MSESFLNLERGTVRTRRDNLVLSVSRVEQVLDSVYGEFAGGAPIHFALIDFSAHHNLPSETEKLPTPDTLVLHKFEYITSTLPFYTLRTKGALALSMVEPELLDGDLSAHLVEPLEGYNILARLYDRWQDKANGLSIPPLCL